MIAPARRVSYQILLQIATSDAHSDELLRSPEVDALPAKDRNLATTLVMGTLRWQLALDVRIRALLARPDAKLSDEAATALRMGAYQLLYLDRVPAHAAIHDGVELVKQTKERGAAGMVNAVLRKVQGTEHGAQRSGQRTGISDQRSGRQRFADGGQRIEGPEPAGELAAAFAHPSWMVERWARRYGLEAAEAICRWDQEAAAVSVRLDAPDADDGGVALEPGEFLGQARRVVQGDVGRSELFRAGRVRIQDEASQLVGEIAAAAAPGAERVLDTCAAPGGKTAILAERLPEAVITAVDVSRKRVLAARAERFARATRDRLQWQVADAATLRVQPEYGLILCDVPCSGTGTIARNPEIRLRVEEAGLERQHARQVAIVQAAMAGLREGGRLVYSTCSLEAEENEAVIEEVLQAHAGLRVVPVGELLDRLAATGAVTAAGRERLRSATWDSSAGSFLRTIPGVHRCDGFFAAVLERL